MPQSVTNSGRQIRRQRGIDVAARLSADEHAGCHAVSLGHIQMPRSSTATQTASFNSGSAKTVCRMARLRLPLTSSVLPGRNTACLSSRLHGSVSLVRLQLSGKLTAYPERTSNKLLDYFRSNRKTPLCLILKQGDVICSYKANSETTRPS